MNNYYYITEYLPVRYEATAQQAKDRAMCYSFKDGVLTDEVKNAFISKIQEITGGDKEGWVICFIPASTKAKTDLRYAKLSSFLSSQGYDVQKDAVYNKYDTDAGHLSGKASDPSASFGIICNPIVSSLPRPSIPTIILQAMWMITTSQIMMTTMRKRHTKDIMAHMLRMLRDGVTRTLTPSSMVIQTHIGTSISLRLRG